MLQPWCTRSCYVSAVAIDTQTRSNRDAIAVSDINEY